MTKRFSYWKRHNPVLPVYEAEYLKWINNRTDLIEGKKVLDAGCGMARNSVFCAKHGAESVVGLEINPSVIPAAEENAQQHGNITIRQADLQEFDLEEYENQFDTVICIGVLHHLPHPKKALDRLRRCLRDGGHLIAMVYSHEGNEGFLRFLKPARVITKRLPLWLLEILTLPVTLFYLCLLPFLRGEYFELQRKAPFSAIHYNIVDQLCPDIANYWTKEEVSSLFGEFFNVSDVVHTNKRTWSVVCKKEPAPVKATENELQAQDQ